VGRSDHLGLKLRRVGDTLVAFPRMCPHEGADLDPIPLTEDCLTCPWHGRRLPPVATLDLTEDEVTATTASHQLVVTDGELHVTHGPA
jgi:nitrite reductase/ring-hydroxylating ferredoxin subunit